MWVTPEGGKQIEATAVRVGEMGPNFKARHDEDARILQSGKDVAMT